MDKLLPCPFCGGSGKAVCQRWSGYDHWGVSCQGECGTFFDCRESSEGSAVTAWNRRAPAPALLALATFGARVARESMCPTGGFLHARYEMLDMAGEYSGITEPGGETGWVFAPGIAEAADGLIAESTDMWRRSQESQAIIGCDHKTEGRAKSCR